MNTITSENINLENEKVKDILMQLINKRLEECVNEERFVSVHINTDKMQIRLCMTPQEADFSVKGIHLLQDMFQITISHEISSIERLNEDSFYVLISGFEIYIDFVDSFEH